MDGLQKLFKNQNGDFSQRFLVFRGFQIVSRFKHLITHFTIYKFFLVLFTLAYLSTSGIAYGRIFFKIPD